MKTTIEIADGLLLAAKQAAAERQTTLRAIVDAALRQHLEERAPSRPRLRRHTFRGRGLRAGLSEGDWAAIRERAYEGRGG
jgi:Arc/MetJ family transcription regulator